MTSVLADLVAVAAADRKSHVRRAVLHALEPRLDPYLAKVDKLCMYMYVYGLGFASTQ